MLNEASVVGKVIERERYVLKVTPVKASANAASTRIAREAELWHRRFNHLGFENLKRAAKMVDGMPSSVANAERVDGTVCVPCVDGKMLQAPHPRSSTKTTKCELVHRRGRTSHRVTGWRHLFHHGAGGQHWFHHGDAHQDKRDGVASA